MAWSNVTASFPTSPPPLSGGALAFDPVDHYLVLFGGCDPQRCPAPAQTWAFTGATGWTDLTNASAQPPARSEASMTFDDGNSTLLLFGGVGAAGRLLNDTWSFVGGHWTNRTTGPSPSPRRSAALAYDRPDGELVLFGGCGAVCPLGDTWTYNGSAWTDLTPSLTAAPVPRWGAGFTYDGLDGYALLVDGCGATTCPLNDSWSFVGNRWTLLTVSLPPKRFDPGLAFIAGPNVTYLYGGNASTHPNSDTWRFSGGKWTNVTTVLGGPPSARSGMAIVPTTDTWPGGVEHTWPFGVMFGGSSSGCPSCPGPVLGDTWVLERALTPFLSASPTIAEIGQTVAFTATSTGGNPPYNFSIQFGDGAWTVGSTSSHAYAQSGLVAARVTVADGAGVRSTGTTLVSVVLGPIVSVAAVPNPVDFGQVVNFTGSATGGTPGYAYRWTFGDGTNASTADVAHRYSGPGSFSVRLTVTDSVGGVGAWSGTVAVHPALSLAASASTVPGVAGEANVFTAVPSGGTSPYTVTWTFGDGGTSAGLVARHSYAARGNYTVVATVADAAGAQATETFALEVTPAPPASPGPAGGLFRWNTETVVLVAVAAVAGAGLLAWWLRRRHHRRPPAPIAAAGVGDPDWVDAERSTRRKNAAAARGGRGWPPR